MISHCLRNKFPHAPGRLALHDLPKVIDNIQILNKDIERMKHDSFTPRPIKDGSKQSPNQSPG